MQSILLNSNCERLLVLELQSMRLSQKLDGALSMVPDHTFDESDSLIHFGAGHCPFLFGALVQKLFALGLINYQGLNFLDI